MYLRSRTQNVLSMMYGERSADMELVVQETSTGVVNVIFQLENLLVTTRSTKLNVLDEY